MSKERAAQCVRLYNLGFTLKEVGEQLGISGPTVRHYLLAKNSRIRTNAQAKQIKKERHAWLWPEDSQVHNIVEIK